MHRQNCFRISPYIHTLSIIGLVGFLLCICFTIYFQSAKFWDKGLYYVLHEYWETFLYMLILCVGYIVATAFDSFSFWGKVRFNNTQVVATAPMRKRIKMLYNEIQYIGIDFGVINNSRQFWIYISKTPIEPRFFRKIHKLPINQNTIRLEYSEKAYNALLSELPLHLRKQLEKGQSIIRIYEKNTD